MKGTLKLLLAGLALALCCCTPKVNPDQTPQEQTPQEQTPADPPKKDYPVDVAEAFQKEGLIIKVKSVNNYSPHSGIDVTEIRYTDYASNPQAVFVMQVDLSDPTVSMTNTVPGGSTVGFTKGAERLSGQFKRIDAPGSKVIGGINTDFFTTTAGATEGQAQGIFWHNGNCLKNSFNSQKTRPRNFVYWDKEEKVTIAASADYAAVRTSTALQEAFSGGQYLVKDGALASIVEDSVYGVHPRTMFGVQKNKQRIILVVLDGRNSVLAAGMNYPDMQRIMLALGSYDAINLDGGGSSTFIVRDTRPEATGFGSGAAFLIRNMPSDGSERAIGPGLAVLASD